MNNLLTVQEIEKQIETLSKLLKKLQDANEEFKAVTKAAAMKAIKKRMEKDIDEVGKIARLAKSKLEELDRENLANRQKPGCGKGSGVDRSRTATTIALKKRLKERMSDFQIFLDMAVLVEAQGDILDNIESQASSAIDHVQSGATALQRAKKLQKINGCA